LAKIVLYGILLDIAFLLLATYSVIKKNNKDTKLYCMLAIICVVVVVVSAQLFHVK